MLVTTGILLVGGTFLIFLFEYDNPASIGKLTLGQKLMASLFQAVTTRTAGFFTVDQAAFTNGTAMLCLFLMLIGGSPMGTAGGIKTTTLAVLVLSIITIFAERRMWRSVVAKFEAAMSVQHLWSQEWQ